MAVSTLLTQFFYVPSSGCKLPYYLRCLLLASLVVTDQAVYPQVGQTPKEDVEGQEEVDVEGGDEQQIKYDPKR